MKEKRVRYLIGILGIAALIRVVVAVYFGNLVDAPPLLTDQRSYHFLAIRLLEGHGFTFEGNWYPFTPADTPTAHWSYPYTAFVAAIYALVGFQPVAVRLAGAVLGGLRLLRHVRRLHHDRDLTYAPSFPLQLWYNKRVGAGVELKAVRVSTEVRHTQKISREA